MADVCGIILPHNITIEMQDIINPMHADDKTLRLLPFRFGQNWPGQRCGAKTRAGHPCPNPCVQGRPKCRMHGGRGGAPSGRRNGRWKHGRYEKQKIEAGRDAIRRVRELERLGRKLGMFID